MILFDLFIFPRGTYSSSTYVPLALQLMHLSFPKTPIGPHIRPCSAITLQVTLYWNTHIQAVNDIVEPKGLARSPFVISSPTECESVLIILQYRTKLKRKDGTEMAEV